MLDSNHKNSSCDYAEQMVTYLYGEAGVNEKIKFEAHLADCSVCAEEIAGFGFVRSSILEWREADFSHLNTPIFDSPVAVKEKLFSAQSKNSGSWFSHFWKQFTFNSAMTTAALGVLAICIGLTLFALNFSGNGEVADNINDKNLTNTTVALTIEIVGEKSKDNIAGNEIEKRLADRLLKSSSKNTDPSQVNFSEKQIIPKNTVVKVSANVAKNRFENSTRTSGNLDVSTKKKRSVQKKRDSYLIDLDDDEDDSIRLADLFAEVDTK